MQIYTGLTGDPVKIDLLRKYRLGVMVSSGDTTRIYKHLNEFPCALDNGAFSAWVGGYPFDEWGFLKTMNRCRERKLNLEFVVAPDIVAGGLDSLAFSTDWARRLPYDRWALAVQDGMKSYHLGALHFTRFRYLFVGGTVDWKWGTAEKWVELAHNKGLKCHIGRVSTVEQLRRARDIGADSCDSTVFVRNDRWDILDEFIDGVQSSLFD